MQILTLENSTYLLNKIPDHVDEEMRFSVLDNTDPQNPDFFFRFALAQGYGFKGPLYDFNDEAEPFPLKERFKQIDKRLGLLIKKVKTLSEMKKKKVQKVLV